MADQSKLVEVVMVFPKNKRPYFDVRFRGGSYAEDTVEAAEKRVREVLKFLVRSVEIDRLPRK
jgi:hypothetical protein